MKSKYPLHKSQVNNCIFYAASKPLRFAVVKAVKRKILISSSHSSRVSSMVQVSDCNTLLCGSLQGCSARRCHASCLGDSYQVVTRPLISQEADTSVLGGIVWLGVVW